ncbi:MAG: hypothetical protein K8I03_06710 [Ignavibacteria bacterium]|nr:hypothetical protein [Ignavibacteria bacterium]
MKNLIRFSIFILVYYSMNLSWITELKAQSWPCGNPAASNYSIPNDNEFDYLSESSVAVHPL